MIFKTPNLDAVELEAIARINEVRKKHHLLLHTQMNWTGFLRRNMIAKAIQGSNTIEGYNVTFDEAVAIVEGEEIDVAVQTAQALQGYRSALTYILRLADDEHVTVNEELIRALHYMMMSYDYQKNPGRWRPGYIYVRRDSSGEKVYEGPDADLVPSLMHELVEDVSRPNDHTPAVIRAAMAHLNLVLIHPFSDGNGRMGRALQTLVLSRDGFREQPFSSIEEYLGSRGNTENYYAVLAEVGAGSWNPHRDARPWVRFCLRAHLQQAHTFERRIKDIARLWSELENEIKKRSLPERTINALYEASIGLRVKSSRYRNQADISLQVAGNDLRKLCDEGLLEPKGEKRGRIYVKTSYLEALRDEAREPRTEVDEVFMRQLTLPF